MSRDQKEDGDDVYIRHIKDLEGIPPGESKKLRSAIYSHCFSHDVASIDEIEIMGEGFLLFRQGTHDLIASFIAMDVELKQLKIGRRGHYMTWVCTAKEERGHGYMRLLLRSAIAAWRKALAAGDPNAPADVTLFVSADKKKAIRVYESVGFRIVHNMQMKTAVPGEEEPAYVMYMPLTEDRIAIDSALEDASREFPAALCDELRTLIIDATVVSDDDIGSVSDGMVFAVDGRTAPIDGPVFYMSLMDEAGRAKALVAALVLEHGSGGNEDDGDDADDSDDKPMYVSLVYNREFAADSRGRLGAYYINELLAHACFEWKRNDAMPKTLSVVRGPLQHDTCEALKRFGYTLNESGDVVFGTTNVKLTLASGESH